MISIKSDKDINSLRRAGRILAAALFEVEKKIKPGISTFELDQAAEDFILKNNCKPSFKGYQAIEDGPKFPTTLCTSVNHQVVHAPATDYLLLEGDIIGVDVGLEYYENGRSYFVDMAKTFGVGKISKNAQKLIDVTRQALFLGLKEIRPGKAISDIGRAVQNHVEENGFSVVRSLVGHGVGFEVHEAPQIPNFFSKNQAKIIIKKGMVLAIEPMVNAGSYQVDTLDDGWTVVTSDGSLSAHFEHTVAVTDGGHEILTNPD